MFVLSPNLREQVDSNERDVNLIIFIIVLFSIKSNDNNTKYNSLFNLPNNY